MHQHLIRTYLGTYNSALYLGDVVITVRLLKLSRTLFMPIPIEQNVSLGNNALCL